MAKINQDRKPIFLAFWIIGIAGCLYLLTQPRFFVGHFGDDARDILAARSLLQGRYSNLQIPGHPALNFPLPGFPFFLSPFTAIVGGHWNALKLIPILLTLLSLVLVKKLFSPLMSPEALRILLCLVAFNPVTVALSSMVIADSCFLVILLCVFLTLQEQCRIETSGGPWIMGGLIAWAGLIRPEGMLLTIALCVALGYERRWRLLVKSLVLPLAIWASWSFRNFAFTGHTSGYAPLWLEALTFQAGGYGSLVGHLALVAQKLFMELLLGLDLGVLSIARGILTLVVSVLMLVLYVQGLARSSEDARWPAPLLLSIFTYSFLHIWLHILWPANDAHYFWPILPFLIIFIMQGMSRWKSQGLALIVSLMVILYGVQIAAALQDTYHPPADQQLPQKTLEWLRTHTPSDAYILAPDAPVITLYTERHALALLGARNAKDFHDRLIHHGIGYVLLAPVQFMFVKSSPGRDPQKLWERIRQTVPATPTDYMLLYTNPAESMSVYKVRSDKAGVS